LLAHFIKIRKYALKIAWSFTVAIVLLSLVPANSLPKFSFKDFVGIDKLGHLFFYGNACFFFLLGRSNDYRGWSLLFRTCLPLILLGLLMELFQAATLLGRSFDYFDMLANVIGVLFALILFKWNVFDFPSAQQDLNQ